MNKVPLQFYQNRSRLLPINIPKNFYLIGTFATLVTVIRILIFRKLLKNAVFTKHFLPLQRFRLINHLNTALFKYLIRISFKRLPTQNVVWIRDPELYYLHNFLNWRFLVFDYGKTHKWKDTHFNKRVFHKNLVFIYSLGRSGNDSRLHYVYKDSETDYQSEIWKYIGAFKSS